MAILIDPPLWPAHGTLWSHLVSDESYDELHAFAALLPLPRRSFDLDHYDIPASLHGTAVELGARPVGSRDVVHGLRSSGLRVRQIEREAVRPVQRRQYLHAEWARLAEVVGVGGSATAFDTWQYLGEHLISRWNEPHRTYHDERHLEDVLLALDHLASRGERVTAPTLLAAWFHDAVYTGATGADELDSANLAASSLAGAGLDPTLVQHVSELILATTPAHPLGDLAGPATHLLDADVSIFATSSSRYGQYARDVREEYAHVAPAQFAEGRARILSAYLGQPTIYRSPSGRELWERRARENLAREIAALRESRTRLMPR